MVGDNIALVADSAEKLNMFKSEFGMESMEMDKKKKMMRRMYHIRRKRSDNSAKEVSLRDTYKETSAADIQI